MSVTKQFAVLGMGRFGIGLAETLTELGQNVLCIDIDENLVQAYSHCFDHIAAADTTDEESLKALGINNFDVTVVAVGNLQNSLLTTLALKELGIKKIIAKALNLKHGKMLEKIGADKVVYPERNTGQRLAHNLASSNILDFIELSPDFGIIELNLPQKLLGKMLKESKIREDFNLNIVALKNKDEITIPAPPDHVFMEGDILIAVGRNKDIKRWEDAN